MDEDYDYETAGFNSFLSRPLVSLEGTPVQAPTRQVNFDQAQVTGALGDTLRIGNILLDGVAGRISVFDDNNNESVRIGELDG